MEDLVIKFWGTEYRVIISSNSLKVIRKPTLMILIVFVSVSALMFLFDELPVWFPCGLILLSLCSWSYQTEIIFSKSNSKIVKRFYFLRIYVYTIYNVSYKKDLEIKYIKYWEGGENVSTSYSVYFLAENLQNEVASFSSESDAQKMKEIILNYVNN